MFESQETFYHMRKCNSLYTVMVHGMFLSYENLPFAKGIFLSLFSHTRLEQNPSKIRLIFYKFELLLKAWFYTIFVEKIVMISHLVTSFTRHYYCTDTYFLFIHVHCSRITVDAAENAAGLGNLNIVQTPFRKHAHPIYRHFSQL